MTLLSDNFHDANGTLLAAHSPQIGGPWISDALGFRIESNLLEHNADNPSAHVESGSKIAQAFMAFDLNGMDTNNFLTLFLYDDAGTNGVRVEITGGGSLFCNCRIGGNDIADGDLYTGSPFQPVSPGPHTLIVGFGPDLFSVKLDGRPVAIMPRSLAKTFAFTRIRLDAGALNAHPSPHVSSLVVG